VLAFCASPLPLACSCPETLRHLCHQCCGALVAVFGACADALGQQWGAAAVDVAVSEALAAFFDKDVSACEAVLSKAVQALRAAEAAKKARELVRRKSVLKSSALPGKLADCSSEDPRRSGTPAHPLPPSLMSSSLTVLRNPHPALAPLTHAPPAAWRLLQACSLAGAALLSAGGKACPHSVSSLCADVLWRGFVGVQKSSLWRETQLVAAPSRGETGDSRCALLPARPLRQCRLLWALPGQSLLPARTCLGP